MVESSPQLPFRNTVLPLESGLDSATRERRHRSSERSGMERRGESTSTTPIPSAPSSPCPGGNTTDIISRNNHSNSGSGGGGGGGQGGRGGGGASRRRQRAEEKNLTVLPGVCTHRRTQRSLSPLAKVPSRGRSTVTRPPSARSQAARSSGVKTLSGMGSEHSQRDVSLLERISVLPAGASADRGLGEGPTVGSTEEAALISKRQKQDARTEHPGPALRDVSNATASETMRALKMERRGPNLVSPHICIGGREDSRDAARLKDLGVTHVLNCATQLHSAHRKDFVHEKLDIMDTLEQDLEPFRKPALRFLTHVEKCGGRALVHCVAGCSRSVSMVLLHLMETHRIRLKVAFSHVRAHRMVAMPNEGFLFQLAMSEVQLLGFSSVSRDADKCWNFYRWNAVKRAVPHFQEPEPPSCGCSLA